jgi:hypothetical protein
MPRPEREGAPAPAPPGGPGSRRELTRPRLIRADRRLSRREGQRSPGRRTLNHHQLVEGHRGVPGVEFSAPGGGGTCSRPMPWQARLAGGPSGMPLTCWVIAGGVKLTVDGYHRLPPAPRIRSRCAWACAARSLAGAGGQAAAQAAIWQGRPAPPGPATASGPPHRGGPGPAREELLRQVRAQSAGILRRIPLPRSW